MSNTKKYFPDIADELDGIARGAGVSINTVLDWVLIDGFSWGFNPCDTMCTNLSIVDCCDEPMLMQTVDAPDGALLLLHRVYPKDGYKHAYIGRLGSIVATSGFNEKGLAIGSVSCFADSQDFDGYVCGMLILVCLQYCSTVDETIELFAKNNLMFGGYTINCMDISRKNVVIEKTPDAQAVRYNENPYIFNTKFVTEQMYEKNAAFLNTDLWEKRGYDRLDTFKRLMESESKPYSVDTMIRVMSDHSTPGPIWDWSTRLGSIIFQQSKKMYVFLGPPDITSFEEIII
jgi:predicted choloylglycine hydrolase